MPASSGTTVRLCGRFEFEAGGDDIAARVRAGQARTLLAYLVVNRDRPVDRAELIEVIWPQRLPKDPQSDLRPILSRLRRALGPVQLEGRDRVQLVLPEPVSIDTEGAARSIASARAAADAGEWELAQAEASRGRELLGGGFLPDQDALWANARREELADLESEAIEWMARAGLALGGADLREAERLGRELIGRAPYREDGYRIVMEALAADGNPAEALRVFDQLRRVLRDELGINPAPELQALHQRLLAGETPPAAAAEEEAPAPTAGPPEATAAVPLPPALSPRERGAFVGREGELQTLERAWERACGGERELILVAGEPGIGKTRLLSEFALRAHDGGTVLYASCPQEAILPYQPIVETLRHYASSHPLDAELARIGPGAVELGLLVPEIGASLPSDAGARSDDPETRRFMMFDAVAALLAAASEREPILLVLDDLHWADPPTLQLLRHLIGSRHPSSLMILGAYREGELTPGAPLAELLAELRPAQRFERIRLGGLDERDVRHLISFHASAEAPATLSRTVHQGTEGNPFFVEEVMRHLIEQNVLFEEQGRWAASLTVERVGVPEGVQEVLLSRLARLSGDSRALLSNAAVIGREFSYEVLRPMVGLDEEAVIGALEEVLGAQLIVEESHDPGSVYGFTHALVRQTLYDGLTGPRRQRMHAEAARAIEAAEGTEGDAQIAALAMHLRLADRAGDPAKAVEYSLRAAARARELLAWDDAAQHIEGVVGLLEATGREPELRSVLLVQLADLMVVIGDVGKQISCLERALALSRRLGDDERTAQVHSRLGMAYSLMDSIYAEFLDIGSAFEHFDAARETLAGGEPRAARGHLEVGVATAQTYGLRIGDGLEAAGRAMEIADELGDELLWSGAAEAYGWHSIAAGELSRGFETIERAFAKAAERRRPFLAWMGSNMAGQLSWGLGDPDAAQVFFERALRLPYIERSAYRQQLADGVGRCHASRGEIEEASALLSDAKPAWFTHSLKPLVELWEGRWQEVEALAAEVLATSRQTGNRWDEWAAEHLAARVLALRGEHEQAAQLLERSLGIVAEGGSVYFEMWVRPDLARALAEVGRPDEASAQIERCREILAGGEDWRGRAGQAEAADGVVLACAGSFDAADAAFSRAVETFDAYRLRCEEAEALHQWGRALAGAGDRAAATEKLDAAAELYRRHEAGSAYLERLDIDRRTLR